MPQIVSSSEPSASGIGVPGPKNSLISRKSRMSGSSADQVRPPSGERVIAEWTPR